MGLVVVRFEVLAWWFIAVRTLSVGAVPLLLRWRRAAVGGWRILALFIGVTGLHVRSSRWWRALRRIRPLLPAVAVALVWRGVWPVRVLVGTVISLRSAAAVVLRRLAIGSLPAIARAFARWVLAVPLLAVRSLLLRRITILPARVPAAALLRWVS